VAARELVLQVVWSGPSASAGTNAEALLAEQGLIRVGERETEFGLQRGRQEVVPGALQADGTLLFETRVQPYRDKAGRQRFRGECVQGPPDDPFLYLSWRLAGESSWIGRGKVSLRPLTAELIDELPEDATLRTSISALGHRPAGHVQEWVAG
jgi:uncharacterized protein DUF5990